MCLDLNATLLSDQMEPWMSDASDTPVPFAVIVRQSWRIFRTHFTSFFGLAGFPVAALVLCSLVMYFFVVPIQPGVPLVVVWAGMTVAQKSFVFLLFLACLTVVMWMLVASIFATRDIYEGRQVRVFHVLGCVRWKHLRLFWLQFFVGMFSVGPLIAASLALGLACAPAIPVAALEDLGAFRSFRRSAALTKDGYGRIALLYLSYFGLLVAWAVAFYALISALDRTSAQGALSRMLVRLCSLVSFWTLLLVPQLYMVALTRNYFDQRARSRELPPDSQPVG